MSHAFHGNEMGCCGVVVCGWCVVVQDRVWVYKDDVFSLSVSSAWESVLHCCSVNLIVIFGRFLQFGATVTLPQAAREMTIKQALQSALLLTGRNTRSAPFPSGRFLRLRSPAVP